MCFSRGGPPTADALLEAPRLRTLVAPGRTQEQLVRGVLLRGVGLRDARISALDEHVAPSGGDWGLALRAALEIGGMQDVLVDTWSSTAAQASSMASRAASLSIAAASCSSAITCSRSWARPRRRGCPPSGALAATGRPATSRAAPPSATTLHALPTPRADRVLLPGQVHADAAAAHHLLPRAARASSSTTASAAAPSSRTTSRSRPSWRPGTINSRDRQPYAHRFAQAQGNFVFREHFDEIRRNFFMGNYYAPEGIDNDDGSCMYKSRPQRCRVRRSGAQVRLWRPQQLALRQRLLLHRQTVCETLW